MNSKIFVLVFILISCQNLIFCQFSIPIGCQSANDAVIGLDRKGWTSDINDVSESYQLNFDIPENMPFSCTVLDRVEVSINGYSATNNIDPSCFLWLYTHVLLCDDHTPISCPDIIYDQQGLQTFFTLDGEDVPEGSTLGVDIVVVVDRTNAMCIPDVITQGFYEADFEICLEAFYVPDEPEEFIDLGDDLELCPGEEITLEGPDGFVIYEWEGPIDGDEQNLEDAIPGVYTLEVTDDNGCRNSDDIEIISIILDPIMTNQPDSIATCSTNLVTIELLNYTDNNRYEVEWQDITGDDLADGTNFQPAVSGDYIIEVTDTNTDCIISDTVNVNIIATSEAMIDGDLTPCEGTEVTLFNQFGQNLPDGYSFEWIIGTDTLTLDTIVIDIVQDSIFLNLADSLGCGTTSDTIILSPSVPELAGNDDNYTGCIGETLDLFTLISVGTTTDGDWIDINQNPIPSTINLTTPNISNTYYYVVSNTLPCPNDTATFIINVSDTDVDAGMDNSTTVCPDEVINLESFITGDMGGFFEDSNNQLITDPNIIANQLLPGLNSFQYIIQSANCGSDSAEISINVLDAITPTIIDGSLCPGEFITINGEEYNIGNMSGEEILTASNGCDSVVTIDLSFFPSADTLINNTLCEDETVEIGGVTFSNTFTQDQILLSNASVNGCDSLIDVDLTFVSAIDTIIDGTLCDDEILVIEGVTFDVNNASDQIVLQNGSSSGCDSIINVDLDFISAIQENLVGPYCPDESFIINGTTYDISNAIGEETLMSANGCDSIINIDLDFFAPNEENIDVVLCDDETLQIGNDVYDRNNQSGTTILDNQDINGCDSIVNVSVDHRISTSFDQTFEICDTDSVFVNGMWVNYSDTFVETLINEAGCDSTITSVVSVINCAVTVQLNAQDESCFGENDGALDFDIDDTNQFPLDYEILNSVGQIIESGVLTGTVTINISNLNPDDYILNIEKDGNNLASEAFTIQAASAISLVPTQVDINCFGENNGQLSVDASGGAGSLSYSWSNGSSSSSISNVTAGDYTLIVEDANGCTVESTYTITQPAELVYDIISDNPDCADQINGSIEISISNGGTTPYSFIVNGVSSQDPVFMNLDAASYNIIIEDANGCQSTDNVVLSFENTLEVMLPQLVEITLGESQMVNAEINFQPSLIQWSPVNGLSCSDCVSPTITPTQSTVYNFYAEDENGCSIEAALNVNVNIPQTPDIYVPNVFSPSSNDGVNNRFSVFPNSSKGVEVKRVTLFDRWGNIVFEGFGNDLEWTGFINGTPAQQGVYVYQVLYSIGTVEKTELGQFTLVR